MMFSLFRTALYLLEILLRCGENPVGWHLVIKHLILATTVVHHLQSPFNPLLLILTLNFGYILGLKLFHVCAGDNKTLSVK